MDKTCFIFGAGDYEGNKVDINNVKNGQDRGLKSTENRFQIEGHGF